MFSSPKIKPTSIKSGNYATPADFCHLFAEKMARLYTLSLLLTSDPRRAEECFNRSLEVCLASRGIFKDWAERWATHTIIKEAIRMAGSNSDESGVDAGRFSPQPSDVEVLARALRDLTIFDRCAYVMTVLEKYSDRECASYLGCSAADVRLARERTMELLGENSLLLQVDEPMLRMIS